ncbi:MAG: hypothetical protein AAF408_10955 [Pseudomonadota bacterium]
MKHSLPEPQNSMNWDKLGFTPGLVLRGFGMRRSGNHAIADWLCRNAPDQGVVFLNNCKPGTSPLDGFSTVEVNGERIILRKIGKMLKDLTKDVRDGAMLLVTYEDTSPAEFTGNRKISGAFDEAHVDKDILVYRSFLNWIASLLKKMQANEGYTLTGRHAILLRVIDRYVRLIEMIGAETNTKAIGVCYDDWFSSPETRQNVLKRIGLECRDNDIGDVQKYGGGSSFQEVDGHAGQLEPGQRWQQMRHDPEFLAVLSLIGQDETLMAKVSVHFPEDIERVERLLSGRKNDPRGGNGY